MNMIIYRGSAEIARQPEIRTGRFHKDFGDGFYCTRLETQAKRRALRNGNGNGYVNVYDYTPDPSLRIKRFAEVTDEWLDFVANCRNGMSHGYDIVEGPMADDKIFNYVENYMQGQISREAFMALAKFNRPTHQILFHTDKALRTLTFLEARLARAK